MQAYLLTGVPKGGHHQGECTAMIFYTSVRNGTWNSIFPPVLTEEGQLYGITTPETEHC